MKVFLEQLSRVNTVGKFKNLEATTPIRSPSPKRRPRIVPFRVVLMNGSHWGSGSQNVGREYGEWANFLFFFSRKVHSHTPINCYLASSVKNFVVLLCTSYIVFSKPPTQFLTASLFTSDLCPLWFSKLGRMIFGRLSFPRIMWYMVTVRDPQMAPY